MYLLFVGIDISKNYLLNTLVALLFALVTVLSTTLEIKLISCPVIRWTSQYHKWCVSHLISRYKSRSIDPVSTVVVVIGTLSGRINSPPHSEIRELSDMACSVVDWNQANLLLFVSSFFSQQYGQSWWTAITSVSSPGLKVVRKAILRISNALCLKPSSGICRVFLIAGAYFTGFLSLGIGSAAAPVWFAGNS